MMNLQITILSQIMKNFLATLPAIFGFWALISIFDDDDNHVDGMKYSTFLNN